MHEAHMGKMWVALIMRTGRRPAGQIMPRRTCSPSLQFYFVCSDCNSFKVFYIIIIIWWMFNIFATILRVWSVAYLGITAPGANVEVSICFHDWVGCTSSVSYARVWDTPFHGRNFFKNLQYENRIFRAFKTHFHKELNVFKIHREEP